MRIEKFLPAPEEDYRCLVRNIKFSTSLWHDGICSGMSVDRGPRTIAALNQLPNFVLRCLWAASCKCHFLSGWVHGFTSVSDQVLDNLKISKRSHIFCSDIRGCRGRLESPTLTQVHRAGGQNKTPLISHGSSTG